MMDALSIIKEGRLSKKGKNGENRNFHLVFLVMKQRYGFNALKVDDTWLWHLRLST